MSTYVLRIEVEGRDRASGPLGGVTSALQRMGEIAGGILGAQLISRIGQEIGGIISNAVGAAATMQNLTIALETLVAREAVREGVVTTTEQAVRTATLDELVMREQLLGAIDEQEKAYKRLTEMQGANSLEAQVIARDIETLKNQLQGLGFTQDGMIQFTTSSTEKTVEFSDALKDAGPAAQDLLNKIRDVSLESPFEYAQIANVFRLNMAFGASSESALDLTKATLDMGAALGFSGDMLDRTSYNLAQAILQGDLTMANMRQLRMVGIDLAEIFKSELGLSIEDVRTKLESGQLTMEEVSDAFAGYVAENFGGSAARMSKTFQGLQSSFNDLFFFAGADLLSPALEKVTVFLGNIFDGARTLIEDGTFKKWGDQLATFVDNLLSLPDKVKGAWESGGIVGLIELIVPEGLQEGAVGLFTGLQDGLDNLKTFWDENGEGIITGIGNLWSAIWNLITGGAEGLDVNALLTGIGDGFRNATQWLVDHGDMVTGAINDLTDGIQRFAAWTKTEEGANTINFLLTFGLTVGIITKGLMIAPGLIAGTKAALAGLGTTLGVITGPVGLLVIGLGLLAGAIVTLGPTAWTTLTQLAFIFKIKGLELLTRVSTTARQILFLFGYWIGQIPGKVEEWYEEIKTAAKNLVDGFLEGLALKWEEVLVWFNSHFGWLIDLANGIYETQSPSQGIKKGVNLPELALQSASGGVIGQSDRGFGAVGGIDRRQYNTVSIEVVPVETEIDYYRLARIVSNELKRRSR